MRREDYDWKDWGGVTILEEEKDRLLENATSFMNKTDVHYGMCGETIFVVNGLDVFECVIVRHGRLKEEK